MNQLMQPPQMQQPALGLTPASPQNTQSTQRFTPEQIQESHAHLTDLQKSFDSLIKLPDSELTMKRVIDAGGDLISKHQLSDGKRGAPASVIAAELVSPDFPQNDAQGTPPSGEALRQFLQKQFDKLIMSQAAITNKFGAPQQQGIPQQ